MMSIHWDVNLNIECSNNEEAVKLANYLTDNYEEDSCIQFQTSGFFINADGDVPISNVCTEVFIGSQTDVREIGSDNVCFKYVNPWNNFFRKCYWKSNWIN